MGRWGGKIYESDRSYDYQATIADLLELELTYWTSPEKVYNNGPWIAQILSIVEIILLLEQYDFSNSVFLSEEKAVQRWRDVFLHVWDGDWHVKETSSYDYNTPEYRKQHRPIAIAMFDYLESVARFWADLSKGSRTAVEPSRVEHPVPYFSIMRWQNRWDKDVVSFVGFTSILFEHLVRDIIYWLSPEKRSYIIGINAYDVWTAADILGFLSERYERTPGINEQVVRTWCDATIEIWKQFSIDDETQWDETDPMYQNVIQVFDRLEYLAKKYPPREW